MKRNIISMGALTLMTAFFFSCSDHGKEASATTTAAKMTDTSVQPMMTQNVPLIFSPNSVDKIIDATTQSGYKTDYENNALLTDTLNQPILGFMMDTAKDVQGRNIDFQTIAGLPGMDNLYVQFGIHGFKVVNGVKKYMMTIMFVPLDKNRHPISNTMTTAGNTTTGAAYDVACPCVNGKGCCPN